MSRVVIRVVSRGAIVPNRSVGVVEASESGWGRMIRPRRLRAHVPQGTGAR